MSESANQRIGESPIALVDYNAGNLTSVKRALDYLGLPCRIVSTGDGLRDAERIIFPGVGHAAAAMATLKERGLDAALRDAFARGTPILGICIGAQIVLTHSEEGDTPCLDLVPGECVRFTLTDPTLKVPHMGWNEIAVTQPHPILRDAQPGDEFYFVHSYYPQPDDAAQVFATCEYGITFPAAIGHKNLFATQFHPEKSGRIGLAMLQNFAHWNGDQETALC
jgi:glutamine amidotransferase